MGATQQLLTCVAWTGSGGTPENLFGSGTPTGTEFTFSSELGMRFSADVNGTITKLRCWFTVGNVGTFSNGNLWTDGGSLLATAAFATVTGYDQWYEVTLGSPISITAGTVYVVSASTPNGYGFYNTSLSSPINNGSHLTSATTGINGVYNAATGSFPNTDGTGQNYYRDVVFVPD